MNDEPQKLSMWVNLFVKWRLDMQLETVIQNGNRFVCFESNQVEVDSKQNPQKFLERFLVQQNLPCCV